MRKIIHVDMDCFYAAVEELYNPSLKGKPVAVGGDPSRRGVLCTANYEARRFGVKAALSTSVALRKCPDLILVPPDFEKYEKESRAIHEIFRRFTNIIEPLSLDEAFLDVTHALHFEGSASLIAEEIRRLIWKERGLRASAGVGPNKLVAKIASDWNKPNGIKVVRPDELDAFMRPLPVRKLFGIGAVTEKKMKALGLQTCADLQNLEWDQLEQIFGNRARDIFDMARGIDERKVEARSFRKSLSVEHTFPNDLSTLDECRLVLPRFIEELEERLAQQTSFYRIKALVIKLKFSDFSSTTAEKITSEIDLSLCYELLEQAFERGECKAVRLVGLGVKFGFDPNENSQLSFSFY